MLRKRIKRYMYTLHIKQQCLVCLLLFALHFMQINDENILIGGIVIQFLQSFLGGNLGLFTGMSILSIVELSVWILSMFGNIFSAPEKTKMKKKAPSTLSKLHTAQKWKKLDHLA